MLNKAFNWIKSLVTKPAQDQHVTQVIWWVRDHPFHRHYLIARNRQEVEILDAAVGDQDNVMCIETLEDSLKDNWCSWGSNCALACTKTLKSGSLAHQSLLASIQGRNNKFLFFFTDGGK